tara:strand:- start:26 stop:208 length:183 start_codon:yes stop_codon:yes gene_type:complete
MHQPFGPENSQISIQGLFCRFIFANSTLKNLAKFRNIEDADYLVVKASLFAIHLLRFEST